MSNASTIADCNTPPYAVAVVAALCVAVARARSLAQSDMPTFTLEEVSQNGAR